MGNNLFVSYDLRQPHQNYAGVIAAIQQLGQAISIHYSLWYVKSPYNTQEAFDRVWPIMGGEDKLIVIDTANNAGNWENLGDEVSQFLQANWWA